MIQDDRRSFIERHYPPGPARSILLTHSRMVADLALELNRQRSLGLDPGMVETAAMLHDVGMVLTDAPGIGCKGTHPYICHGYLGADMLRGDGLPEWVARVAERHTGSGLTFEEIEKQGLPLPTNRLYLPESPLERLVCYADKFFSKNPGTLTVRKSFDSVVRSMERLGAGPLARFMELAAEFGSPDKIR